MFEFEIQGPRHVRLRIGRWHFRTWRSWIMKLPKGYRRPEIAYAVEWDHPVDHHVTQLGAFFSAKVAEACRADLEREGFTDLHINMIPVHDRLEDWEFDR